MEKYKWLHAVRSHVSKLKAVLKVVLYGFLATLCGRKWSWFEDDLYKEKRIIIIGPASSSLTYLPGNIIDDFDLILRVNKSPLTISGKENKIGSRTDVLYHCCDEDQVTGGGPIIPELLLSQNNVAIIYTYCETHLMPNFIRCVIKYPALKFFRTAPVNYFFLKSGYKARTPTTGIQALSHVMNSDFKELHITGFTFFKTEYIDDYRDDHKSGQKAAALAVSKGNHDPDDELRLFAEIYKNEVRTKDIFVDSVIEEIMRSA